MSAEWAEQLFHGLYASNGSNFPVALNYLKTAHASAVKAHGETHVYALACLLQTSATYLSSRDQKAAYDILNQTGLLSSRASTDPRNSLINYCAKLAKCCATSQGSFDLAALDQVLEEIRVNPDLPPEFCINFMLARFTMLLSQEAKEEIWIYFDSIEQYLRENGLEDYSDLLLSYGRALATLCQGEYSASRKYIEEVLFFAEQSEIDCSRLLVSTILLMAGVLISEGQDEIACMYIDWGSELLSKMFPSNHPVTLDTQLFAALFYLRQANFEKAMEYFNTILVYIDPVSFPAETLMVLNEMLLYYQRQQNAVAVKDFYNRIKSLYEDAYPMELEKNFLPDACFVYSAESELHIQREIAVVVQNYSTELHPLCKFHFSEIVFDGLSHCLSSVATLFADFALNENNKERPSKYGMPVEEPTEAPTPTTAAEAKKTQDAQDSTDKIFADVSKFMTQGQFVEAYDLVSRKINELEKMHGRFSARLAPMLEGMAMVCDILGKKDEAEDYRRRLKPGGD